MRTLSTLPLLLFRGWAGATLLGWVLITNTKSGGFIIAKKVGFILRILITKVFGFTGQRQIGGYGHIRMFILGAGMPNVNHGLTFALKVRRF